LQPALLNLLHPVLLILALGAPSGNAMAYPSRTLSALAIFPSIFREDPRCYHMGKSFAAPHEPWEESRYAEFAELFDKDRVRRAVVDSGMPQKLK
jgi:hypothetical protein